jgi:hypothetical protein
MDQTPQRGQVLALFALALSAIVLAAAVVVDGGFAFAQRRVAQNAADFAAMAGTRVLGQNLTGHPAGSGTAANVREAIHSVLAANAAELVRARYVDDSGEALGDVETASSIPGNAFGVVVDARTRWQPFLLGIIGVSDWAATASATAITPGESLGGGVLPIGIEDDRFDSLSSCEVGALATCLQQALTPGHQIGPGSFGWLSFGLQGNGGKCDWENSLGMIADGGCEMNQPFLQSLVGPVPPADTHGCCTAVGDPASEDKIGALTGNEWADLSFYIDNQIPVWVPIYSGDLQGTGSHAYYDIVGFGALVLIDEDGSQHAKWLKGSAIETPWCAVDGHAYCAGPGGAFNIDVTGAVQLVR